MSVQVTVYVEDIATQLLSFDEIRLYRDTTPYGAFTTLVDDIVLVAGQTLYTYEDDNGDATSWYRYTLWNSTSANVTDPSAPFRGGHTTLAAVRLEAAALVTAGFSGVATGGSSSTLVDEVLRDNATEAGYLAGGWVFRPAAAEDDQVHRLTEQPFDAATGALTVVRAYDSSPTAGEAYQVYTLVPPLSQSGWPYSWSHAVNDGLRDCWIDDEIIVAEGDGIAREFSLTGIPGVIPEQIYKVTARTVNGDYIHTQDLNRNGQFWDIPKNAAESTLVLSHVPHDGVEIRVHAQRRPDPVYQESDVITVNHEIVTRATVLALYRHLNMRPPTAGKYQAEVDAALRDWQAEYGPKQPRVRMVGPS